MTPKTEAIILSLHAKNDTSSLLEVYTRNEGRSSYLVFGNKWRSTLQPMAIVELTSQGNPARELRTLSSATRLFVPKKNDITHTCLMLFMAEAIEKSLRHPMEDETLFDWLISQIKKLDQTDELQMFPNEFLVALSEQLGYGGVILDEWRSLKSLDIIQTVLLQ